MVQTEIDDLASLIWDYHHLGHNLKKADCILALGSHDIRVAEYAASLYLQKYASFIIFSGGLGNLTTGLFTKPEAEVFSEVAQKLGVPKEKIIIENQSTNTGENIIYTKKLLTEQGVICNSFLLVQKPYMERRAYATFKKIWPDKECLVTSPPITFANYPNSLISKDELINIMVGDLQRIKKYYEASFQIYQAIPDEVWAAYQKLVGLGYTKHLI